MHRAWGTSVSALHARVAGCTPPQAHLVTRVISQVRCVSGSCRCRAGAVPARPRPDAHHAQPRHRAAHDLRPPAPARPVAPERSAGASPSCNASAARSTSMCTPLRHSRWRVHPRERQRALRRAGASPARPPCGARLHDEKWIVRLLRQTLRQIFITTKLWNEDQAQAVSSSKPIALTKGRRLDHPAVVRIAREAACTPAQALLARGLGTRRGGLAKVDEPGPDRRELCRTRCRSHHGTDGGARRAGGRFRDGMGPATAVVTRSMLSGASAQLG